MFVLFEKNDTRYVYDLKDRTRLESFKQGGELFLSCYYMEDKEFFSNQSIGARNNDNNVKFINDDEVYLIYEWLSFVSWENIRLKQNKRNRK